MKKLAFLSLIFISHVSFAFEPTASQQRPKRSAGEAEIASRPKAERASEVTFISSDGQQFTISKKVAEKSGTIKNLIQDIQGSSDVSASQFNGALLRIFIDIAQEEEKLETKDQKIILESLSRFLPNDLNQLFEVQNLAYSFAYPLLQNLVAYKIAKEYSTEENAVSLDPLVAKYYYLINGKKLSYVHPDLYGFSIDELRSFDRFERKVSGIRGSRTLNLNNLYLNSLNGLDDIPEFEKTNELDLSRNKLESLPSNFLNKLTDLRWLNLANNNLTNVDNKIFNYRRNKLEELRLYGNSLLKQNIENLRKCLPNTSIISEPVNALLLHFKISLISSDDQEFIVPKEIAEKSETIKWMLSEAGGNQVPLSNVDGKTLQFFIDIGKEELASSKKNKQLLDALSSHLPTSKAEIIKLINAANYLDYPTLLNLAVRKFSENLPTDWQSKILRDLYPLVAKYYYLLNGQNLAGVDENSYGFSIRELREYKIFKGKENRIGKKKSLILRSMRINNLDGLDDIPNVKIAESLDLSNNKLTSLPIGLLLELKKLLNLNLSNNNLAVESKEQLRKALPNVSIIF